MTHHPYDALLIECAGLRARIAELEEELQSDHHCHMMHASDRARIAELEAARDEAQRHLTVERARAKFLDAECTRRQKMLQARRAELDRLESELAEARSDTIAALKRAVKLGAEVERLRAGDCGRNQSATQPQADDLLDADDGSWIYGSTEGW